MESVLSKASTLLVAGGVVAALAAIWHLLCIIGGPGWYEFARAPLPIIESARKGTFLAPLGATTISLLMFACTLYSLSGAGLIKSIPLLKTALFAISFICLLRALAVILFLLHFKFDVWELVASCSWLFVGICFLVGALEKLRVKRENT